MEKVKGIALVIKIQEWFWAIEMVNAQLPQA